MRRNRRNRNGAARRRVNGGAAPRIKETIRVRVSSSTMLSITPKQCAQIQGIGRPVKAVRATLKFVRDAQMTPTTVQMLAVEPPTNNTVYQSPTIPSSINTRRLNIRWPQSVAPYPADSGGTLVNIRHGTFQTGDSTSIDGILTIWFRFGNEISEITAAKVLTTEVMNTEPEQNESSAISVKLHQQHMRKYRADGLPKIYTSEEERALGKHLYKEATDTLIQADLERSYRRKLKDDSDIDDGLLTRYDYVKLIKSFHKHLITAQKDGAELDNLIDVWREIKNSKHRFWLKSRKMRYLNGSVEVPTGKRVPEGVDIFDEESHNDDSAWDEQDPINFL